MRLHDRYTDSFETGEVLNNAYNVKETRILNDTGSIEFDYPYDEKARLISQNMLVSVNGHIYEISRTTRNMNGADSLHVYGTPHFVYEAQKAFIPTIGDNIGKSSRYVLKQAIDIISDFKKSVGERCIFHIMTEAELTAKGMKWVADDELLIDFFATDKTNLWDVIKTIIEDLGRGEIYHETGIDSSNNVVCNIAIVERIGKDNGVRLRLEKNMQSLSIERNVSDMITRLWAFGSDDLTVSSVNGGKAYIDSPNIEKYGVQEGEFYFLPVEEKKKISNGLLTGNGFVYPYMASALCGYAARETDNAELAYQVWQVLIHSLAGKDKKDNFDIGIYKNYFNNENLEEMFWISTNFTSQWCLNVIVALELTKDYIKDSINDYEWADWVK